VIRMPGGVGGGNRKEPAYPITPTRDGSGNIIGYHSNRRVPERRIVEGTIIPLYRDLLAQEARFENRKDGLQASVATVTHMLAERSIGYDEFVLTL